MWNIFPSDADLNAYKWHLEESGWNKKFYSDTTCFIVSHILNIIRTISILGWDCGTIIIFHLTQIFECKYTVQWTNMQWDDTVWWCVIYITPYILYNSTQVTNIRFKEKSHFYLGSSNREVTPWSVSSSAQWTDIYIYVRMFPLIHYNVIDIFLNCYFHKSKF